MSRRLFWDAFTGSIWVKAVALTLVTALVVVQCGREGGKARSLESLNYDSLPADKPRPTKPAEKLHATAAELKELLAVQAKQDLSDDQADAAREARTRIAEDLRALGRQFDADRAKLKELDGEAALARLDDLASKTDTLKHALEGALARVPTNGDRAGARAAAATEALAALSPEEPEHPLSAELAFGVKNGKPASVALSAGITPAYSAPVSTEAPSDLPRDPAAEDLADADETRVTPAIETLARQLGHDPVRIYDYVRNNIRYEPYYGIRKGADLTLAVEAGSDADQAALLVALLRESGIHARFVQGVAELPAAKAAAWLGVDTGAGERLGAVPDILATGGVPTSQVRADGQLTKVRFNHIWAEAYVADTSYRGTDEGLGARAWLPLDPSIKETVVKRPKMDVTGLMTPLFEEFGATGAESMESVGDGGYVAPPVTETEARSSEFREEIKSALRAHGATETTTIGDAIGTRTIRPRAHRYLPSSTPFRSLEVSGELRSLPSRLASSVTIAVTGSDPLSIPDPDPGAGTDDGFTYSASTVDLAGQRVTLGYAPATEEDAEIIDAYHGLLNGPSYGAALVPVLRVGGKVVARGRTAVSTGYTQKLTITYRSPGFAPSVVDNPVSVGSLSALSLDLGAIDSTRLKSRGAQLHDQIEASPGQSVLTDARVGELFGQLGDLYFLNNDRFNQALAESTDVAVQRQLSGAIVATDVAVSYIAGFPVSTRLTGATIDVDQDVLSGTARGSNPEVVAAFGRGSGQFASHSEAEVLTSTLGGAAVSTTSVIGKAMTDRVPVFGIDRSNVDAALGRVTAPERAKAEMRAAVVERDARVVVPQRPVTIGGWTGIGYVIEAGERSDYRIQGGASGGTVVADLSNQAVAQAAQNAEREALEEECEHLTEEWLMTVGMFIIWLAHFGLVLTMSVYAWPIFFFLLFIVLVLEFAHYAHTLKLQLKCDDIDEDYPPPPPPPPGSA
jgi:transglutaminase-like putative cysteine protease